MFKYGEYGLGLYYDPFAEVVEQDGQPEGQVDEEATQRLEGQSGLDGQCGLDGVPMVPEESPSKRVRLNSGNGSMGILRFQKPGSSRQRRLVREFGDSNPYGEQVMDAAMNPYAAMSRTAANTPIEENDL